jgi:hypothetical protein
MIDMAHATPELFAAMAKAQGVIENASKNAANPHFRSKYADLAEVLNTIREPLAANGLSLSQHPSFDGALVSVTTIIAHASGGWISSVAYCVPAKSDAQAIGSATTYLRRYAAAAVAGIAQEDDDGNAAAHDRKPAQVSDEAKVKAQDFADAIRGCDTVEALQALGKEMAAAGLPASLLAGLRAAFSARMKGVARAQS